jgi:hypothetical protein
MNAFKIILTIILFLLFLAGIFIAGYGVACLIEKIFHIRLHFND